MQLLYNIFLRLYKLGIYLASPFNPKAKKWIAGRRKAFVELSSFADKYPNNIWVHCASVGEFEQGYPFIQELKKNYPQFEILTSFFSPSGYDFVAKKFPDLNIIYLPLDTKKNAKKWVETLSPQAAFFIKYEFWHYYFDTLSSKKVPLFLVSAVFWQELFFFKSYGAFFRKALKKVTHFFLQDIQSQKLLSNIEIENTSVTGDTRFDRVLQLKKELYSNPRIEQFIKGNNTFIAGSTWDDDIPILKKIIDTLPDDFKIIIVPHEVSNFAYNKFSNIQNEKYSGEEQLNSKILFVDTLGILSKIYRFANLVYVGGGFGKGIHNVLEPAAYNKPILIGPNFQQFLEARELAQIGLLHIVENQDLVEKKVHEALDIKADILRSNVAFFAKNTNVSEQILVFIKKHGFLD